MTVVAMTESAKRVLVGTLVLAGLAVVAACGGGDGTEPEPTVEAAVQTAPATTEPAAPAEEAVTGSAAG